MSTKEQKDKGSSVTSGTSPKTTPKKKTRATSRSRSRSASQQAIQQSGVKVNGQPKLEATSPPIIVQRDPTPETETHQAKDGPAPIPFPAVLSRPPIRPAITSISKSKFDLEPNPFEQSFSRSSTSIHSHYTAASADSTDDVNKDVRRDSTQEAKATGGRSGSQDSQEGTALPPVSALTSPAPMEAHPHFSWSGLSSSLRAGPLSPAMLTGPAGSHLHHGPSALGQTGETSASMTPQPGTAGFDPSTFRTGFTPGAGNGFTPGFGGMMGLSSMVNGMPSFPLPSPNTAAFLNNFTNNTPGVNGANGSNTHIQQGASDVMLHEGQSNRSLSSHPHMQAANRSQANGINPSAMVDITPNTLNALTGVINQMDSEERAREEVKRYNNQNGQETHQQQLDQGRQGQENRSQQRGQMHHADSYFPQQIDQNGHPVVSNGTGNPHQFHPGAMHGNHMMQHGSMPPSHLHTQPGMLPSHMDYRRNDQAGAAPSTAVDGLFLLSQAHQELSKREELKESSPEPIKNAPKKGAKTSKRKNEDAPVKTKPPAKRAKKSAAAQMEPPSDFEMDDDEMGDVPGYDDGQGGDNRKPETEEEKRKNFLERNRQAALKCRQRKKAWLNSLQSKVDHYQGENERLMQVINNLTGEVSRISAVLQSHRECPGMPASMAQLGVTLPPLPPGMMPPGMMAPPGHISHGAFRAGSNAGYPAAV